ncbi:MAG: hypothetical protein Kow0026_14480 [Oricola sp.]
MRRLPVLMLACFIPLSAPAHAEPTWSEAVDWLRNKFVGDGPYAVRSRELKEMTWIFETTSIADDGCNLLIGRRTRHDNDGRMLDWRVDYVFPVKNYHRIEVIRHRNHGYSWIQVYSWAKDVQTEVRDSSGTRNITDGDLEMYIDMDAYPDFATRLDAAFKHLSALARSNAACGKAEAF